MVKDNGCAQCWLTEYRQVLFKKSGCDVVSLNTDRSCSRRVVVVLVY